MIRKLILLLTAFLLLTYTKAENIPGYTLIEKRFVKEVNAWCYSLEHNKSGARIFKVASDDPNKTFSIGFKTLPEDDCGTAHILEHSVLNGSKNFPVKSPFDVLLKGSLNTFLNAFTSKDRTVYPAASLNEKDYFNLMNVYFDAVFYPLIYEDPQIFQQEGWHYELTDPEEPIIYKGVVYNEMLGAFSSPEREMFYQANRHLFPDNTYGFSSGGYPESIPDLTYETFINFHKKYYHPSNSYILLYGNADMTRELHFIDSAYLSHFERMEANTDIPLHEPFDQMKEITEYYSVPEGSNTDKQSYISLSFVIGDGTDESMGMALQVLVDVLVNQESAPVRLALQEAGLGSNVYARSYALRQHFMQIVVTNADPEDASRIREVIFSTLENLAEEGLDKESVEGTINRMEFTLREGDDANKGITLNFMQIPNWIHANDPFAGIEYEKPLAEVKNSMKTDYLEQIIQREFIDNPYKLLLVLAPQGGLEKEKTEKLSQLLAAYKSSLSPEEIDNIIASTTALLVKQDEEDSPEALATIPMLSLEDIDPETNWFEVEEKKINGNTILHFDEFTNSILYAHFMFDLRVLPEDLIPWLGIFRELQGKLNTDNYTYADLEKALRIHTGGYNSSLPIHLDSRNDYSMVPQFRVEGKATMDKVDPLFDLTGEILLKTDYSDTARIRTILTKHHASIEAAIKSNGFRYALRRVNAYHSDDGLFQELTSGIEYYWFLSKLLEDYENSAATIAEKMETISSSLFTRENLDMGIICPEEDYARLEKKLTAALSSFPSKESKKQNWELKPEAKNEGFMTASKIQYVLEGANYFDLGYDYSGTLLVMNKIINSDWLQKEVRIKGGAYGGFAYFLDDGKVFFGSYRDPNLKATLEVFAATPEFLENYETDHNEMVRSIIGTIADLDLPMTPPDKGSQAIRNYYAGHTKENRQKIRDEVLSATAADIRKLAPVVQTIMDQKTYCVYGNEEVIEQNKDLFKTVRTIVD